MMERRAWSADHVVNTSNVEASNWIPATANCHIITLYNERQLLMVIEKGECHRTPLLAFDYRT